MKLSAMNVQSAVFSIQNSSYLYSLYLRNVRIFEIYGMKIIQNINKFSFKSKRFMNARRKRYRKEWIGRKKENFRWRSRLTPLDELSN